MSIVPTNLAASVANAQAAERPEVREKDRKEKVRTGSRTGSQRDPDQVVVALETTEAVRNLAGNTEEQAREDRQARPAYDPRGHLRPGAGRPHVDIEG